MKTRDPNAPNELSRLARLAAIASALCAPGASADPSQSVAQLTIVPNTGTSPGTTLRGDRTTVLPTYTPPSGPSALPGAQRYTYDPPPVDRDGDGDTDTDAVDDGHGDHSGPSGGGGSRGGGSPGSSDFSVDIPGGGGVSHSDGNSVDYPPDSGTSDGIHT